MEEEEEEENNSMSHKNNTQNDNKLDVYSTCNKVSDYINVSFDNLELMNNYLLERLNIENRTRK